jgi:hypothetical protein
MLCFSDAIELQQVGQGEPAEFLEVVIDLGQDASR